MMNLKVEEVEDLGVEGREPHPLDLNLDQEHHHLLK